MKTLNYPQYITDFDFDFKKKKVNAKNMTLYNLAKLCQMFKYSGLPDTIPQRDLELLTMTKGYSTWVEHDGKVYDLMGGLGGELNYNYMPRFSIIANPYLPSEVSRTYEIDKDCVIMPNDSMYLGVLPILNKYATMLSENELTIFLMTVISRVRDFLVCNDDKARKSAEKYIADLFDGNIGVMAEKGFMDNIRSIATGSGSGSTKPITEFIELEQYFKGSMFNELGLKSQFNMKREALNTSESDLNDSILLPFIDDMIDNRKKAIEKINKMFGLNITIEFNSAWEELEETTEDEPNEDSTRVEEPTEPTEDTEKGGEDNEDKETD